MKQSLQLRLGQHLTMTPQLQQAIRLLQLSTLELQTEVQQALESNVMLEEVDDQGASGAENGEATTEPDAEASVDLDDAIPGELEVDAAWDEVYDGAATSLSAPEANGFEFENQSGAAQTLQEYLHWQLGLAHLSDRDRVIGAAIIDSIDDDGYLQADIEEICEALERNGSDAGTEPLSSAEVAAMLRQIQNFDPPGVGARDLRECLLIQLHQLSPERPWREEALRLVDQHLALLGAHEYAQLRRTLGIEEQDLRQVITLIQSLNPRPGGEIQTTNPEYVVPDVFVYKQHATWQVELNPDALPRVRINPRYASLIRRADNSAENNCLRAHMQEARWLIKSLKSRSETLLKVARCIVERQQAFLEHGEESMRPMVLHDVAEAVGMHESTISRVTSKKYMHTPRGVYELKYFFSSHLTTKEGGEASSTAIRALLRKLIAAENPKKPLSDSKLASILSEQGINVARRTVAKYRDAMVIPSSSERRRMS